MGLGAAELADWGYDSWGASPFDADPDAARGFESTYDHDFGGMSRWAVSSTCDMSDGSRRRGYAGAGAVGRARSAGAGGRRPQSAMIAAARARTRLRSRAFTTRETPRGKFCAFPTSLTRLLPSAHDPLGYTPYGPSSATGLAAIGTLPARRGAGVWEEAEASRVGDGLAWRGRACRFPRGGYSIGAWDISGAPDDEPAPLRPPYAGLEAQPRGRGCRYPRELDPYPAFQK
eukprot:TRINITY_DN27552_c0_g1_i1.p1 TRINITY_DN27552_c0_g1~~TRINITY_DN27552_c0_g1_i1.p1  ORF type:complete len:231 (-),score=36.15 TRINITY_DN27552_c0_g1_i1:47-739(-)